MINICKNAIYKLPKTNGGNGFKGMKSSFYTTTNTTTSGIKKEKEKFYSLSQFPYPSGNLHMGHVRVYTMSDCIARLKRMQGYDVIHPMGWDSFGLPAENAAIDKQVSPNDWTNLNINSMRNQLKQLDFQFDWQRELSTSNQDYYRWTQDIFLRLYKSGLAYKKSATVNWDPIDQTVLANEQVDAQGRSWRSNAIVERKQMKQWFFKITSMADRLVDDLDTLPGWSDEIKNMQKEWIGRSYGHLVEFKSNHPTSLSNIKVFTTRVETLYGVSFISISPQHHEMEQIKKLMPSVERLNQLESYLLEIQELKKQQGFQEEEENLKTFNTGITFTQPITGGTKQIPLIISNFVHADYGTGAVMGVPSHNRSDYQVALAENLKCTPVLQPPKDESETSPLEPLGDCYDLPNCTTLINSGEFTGKSFKELIDHLESSKLVEKKINFRIHDWLISRQRYWGTPIPIINCEKCGDVPVPEKDLPVVLPTDIQFTGKGNLLNQLSDWKNVKCPCCNGNATRETDTMDTFVDSSWYYLRFLDPKNSESIFNTASVNKYMPIDVYVGGIEHAILHLLYSRFITKFLQDQSLINHSEPFKVLLAQGLVKSPTYRDSITNKPIHPNDIEKSSSTSVGTNNKSIQPIMINKATGNQVSVTIEKMSKSKLNGIDPNEIIEKYGSDTLKTFILFKAPPEKSLDWDSQGIEGCKKWLTRIQVSIDTFLSTASTSNEPITLPVGSEHEKQLKDLVFETHSTINKVTESIDKHSFNTGIAALMELSNSLQKSNSNLKLTKEYFGCLRVLVLLLFPFSPNFSSTNWKSMVTKVNSQYRECDLSIESYGNPNEQDVLHQNWPIASSEALKRDFQNLVVQFNGKTRGVESIPTTITDFKDFVINSPKYSNRFNDQTIDQIFIGSTKNGNSINFTFKKQ